MKTRNQWKWMGAVALLLALGLGGGCSRNFNVPTSPNVTWGTPTYTLSPTLTTTPLPLTATPTITNTPAFTPAYSTTPVPPTATNTAVFTVTPTYTAMPVTIMDTQGSGMPAISTHLAGDMFVPIAQIVLTNPGAVPATVTSITLTENGAPAGGVTAIDLLENGSPLTSTSFTGSTAIFTLNTVVPANNGSVTLLAEANFSSLASAGTYSFTLSAASGNNGQPVSFSVLPLSGATVNLLNPSPTNTPTGPTYTYTGTNTPSDTFTPTFTSSATNTFTWTDTPVPTNTLTPTDTNPPGMPTNTPADTPVPPTATDTAAFSPTASSTSTPVDTSTFTPTSSPTSTRTATATPTVTFTFTATYSPTVTSTRTVTPTSTATSACAIQGTVFVHPGAWSSCSELAFVKAKIAANAQPWTQQLSNLLGQANGNSSGVNFNGTSENSCTQEGSMQTDSCLCYECALYWYLTGNNTYYTKAMNILGNYATMTGLQSTSCYSGQCQLDGGWFGVCFANACELLRTSPNWTPANTTTYKAMFQNAFYPVLNSMCTGNGNIDLTQIDAMLSMAVFCDDQTEWNSAITRYQARMPAYYYSSAWPTISSPTNNDPTNTQPAAIAGDTGNGTPFPDAFWYNPQEWIAGLEQETCRDNGHHVQFALDAAMECAEIDYHQGSPAALYTTYQTSLVPASELLAEQFVNNSAEGTCTGAWNPQGQVLVTFEIGYNEYVNRLGQSMPYTSQWLTTLRANSGATANQFNIEWETLTHDGVN